MTRVVVVGGGIAGLAAAYDLHKAGAVVTLVEKDRLGGSIRTTRVEDYLVEEGPDAFIVTKPAAEELCKEIGLGDRLIPMRSRRVYVFSGGRLHELPEGLFLTVPTKVWPFLTSSLISLGGKLRMGMDLILPRGPEVEDESVGSFIRRRLGQEALDKLAEPLMAGIFVASPDELSLQCSFPRFAEMEREHRSLIKALRKLPAGGNRSPFVSLRGGLMEFVDRLVAGMPGVSIQTGSEVVALELGWKVKLPDETIEADAVVLAVPAHAAAKLWPGVPPLKYVSTAVVTLAYPKFRELDGAGFVVPRLERRRLSGCTWSSNKFEGRAPEDRLLVRCFLGGGEGDPAKAAHEELREILGVPGDPLMARVAWWREANPVYGVGHQRRVREFEATLPPGLVVAGAGFHGVGIPDAVRSGRAAARSVINKLFDL